MEQKVKLWRTPSVGLMGPVKQKDPIPVTHRGRGAFVDADFKKAISIDESEEMSSNKSTENSTDRLKIIGKDIEQADDVKNTVNKSDLKPILEGTGSDKCVDISETTNVMLSDSTEETLTADKGANVSDLSTHNESLVEDKQDTTINDAPNKDAEIT